jgi:hypothetical protein
MVEKVGGIFDVPPQPHQHNNEVWMMNLPSLGFEEKNLFTSFRNKNGEKKSLEEQIHHLSNQVQKSSSFLSAAISTIQKDCSYTVFIYNTLYPLHLNVFEDDETFLSCESNSEEDDDDDDKLSSCSSSSSSSSYFSSSDELLNHTEIELQDTNITNTNNKSNDKNSSNGNSNSYSYQYKNQVKMNQFKHWTGIFNEKEMILYPPSNMEHLKKESIVNLMDIADELQCENVFVYLERDNEHAKEFARAFIYAGFEMIHPSVKQLESNRWLVFGCEL